MLKSATMIWLGVLAAAVPAAAQDGPYYRPSVVVQLTVSDLGKAIDWYEKVLGFKTVERRDDLKFAHVQTNVPGLELGLGEGGALKGTGAVVINFSVYDVAAARTLLESRGVIFTGPTVVSSSSREPASPTTWVARTRSPGTIPASSASSRTANGIVIASM